MNIGILNLGFGNIYNILKVIDKLNIKTTLINKSSDFKNISHLILPGVGSFRTCMKQLKRKKIIKALKKTINEKPIMAICLGMQILFTKSNENGKTRGLNIISGNVTKIDSMFKNAKCPNFGHFALLKDKKFKSLSNKKFYFAHSYFCKIEKIKNLKILYLKTKHMKIPALIKYKNILAVQFHPELSRENGIKFYKNFITRKW